MALVSLREDLPPGGETAAPPLVALLCGSAFEMLESVHTYSHRLTTTEPDSYLYIVQRSPQAS